MLTCCALRTTLNIHTLFLAFIHTHTHTHTHTPSYFSRYFPDTPVLSSLGNHEAFPVDQYEGRARDGKTGDSWLYDTVANDWAHWLPDQAVKTVKYGGFYAARAMPNLVVISMNNNMFQSGDLWWKFNGTDVNNQFPFLIDALQQVRALKIKAIIIGHEHGLAAPFERQFHDIVSDFQDVIIGQHYGHAHASFTCAFRDHSSNSSSSISNGGSTRGAENNRVAALNKPGTPLHSVYIGNSVTTYSALNPGFAIYHYDRDFLQKTPPYNIAHDYEEYVGRGE